MIKLIALDLDGTLLEPAGRIAGGAREAIAQARAAGGKILTYDLGGADLRVDNKAKQLHALTVKGGSLLAAGDPYYNKNLSLSSGDCSLK